MAPAVPLLASRGVAKALEEKAGIIAALKALRHAKPRIQQTD